MSFASPWAALQALLAADNRLDKAQDDLCAAKRTTGKRHINPLDICHPAVIEKRAAVEHRNETILRVEQFLQHERRNDEVPFA